MIIFEDDVMETSISLVKTPSGIVSVSPPHRVFITDENLRNVSVKFHRNTASPINIPIKEYNNMNYNTPHKFVTVIPSP